MSCNLKRHLNRKVIANYPYSTPFFLLARQPEDYEQRSECAFASQPWKYRKFIFDRIMKANYDMDPEY